MTEGRSPTVLVYSEGLVLRSVGARQFGLKRRARRSERLGSWNERLGSFVRARLPVLKGELVKVSNWAHGVSGWARL